ncbi:MAG: hypothetical protein ACTSVI_02040 [Promethearchaeota archaeon]
MRFRKLDYIMDRSKVISMIIYNTHPENEVFIAPKYFPDVNGIWESHDNKIKYSRFEYYWNLKRYKDDGRVTKVYDVDDNPLHGYDLRVLDKLQDSIKLDPCHGAYFFQLDKKEIIKYFDASEYFKKVMEDFPPSVKKFEPMLKKVANAFSFDNIGITGSYLYNLYQPFSDLNVVIYDKEPFNRFHDFLSENDALEKEKKMTIKLPRLEIVNDENSKNITGMIHHGQEQEISLKERFIGSMHDENNEHNRVGFWLTNTEDQFNYGHFQKMQVGEIFLKATISGWEHSMASGNFTLSSVKIIGVKNAKLLDERDAWRVDFMQIIGEFNRMFLFDEEVYIHGLLQEVKLKGKKRPLHEVLVGSREVGGWVLPTRYFN